MNKNIYGLIAVGVASMLGSGVAFADKHEAKKAGAEYCSPGCKGHSDCHGHGNDGCKGSNECKGKGWIEAKDAADCKGKGGEWKKADAAPADKKGKKK